MALQFQQKDRTDYERGQAGYSQRRADMAECGLPHEKYDDYLFYMRDMKSSETRADRLNRQYFFVQCLKDKGYAWLPDTCEARENWESCRWQRLWHFAK